MPGIIRSSSKPRGPPSPTFQPSIPGNGLELFTGSLPQGTSAVQSHNCHVTIPQHEVFTNTLYPYQIAMTD